MLRAFRILRLFRRIESLNKIIVSLAKALPGLLNAGVVMLLVMCIYAILAVDLYGSFAERGYYVNNEHKNMSLVTMRGYTFDDEYYGDFFRSLYTLFQVSPPSLHLRPKRTGPVNGLIDITFLAAWVCWLQILTGESWSEAVARPLIFADHVYSATFFHVSFILLCGIVLVNVVVAVVSTAPHGTYIVRPLKRGHSASCRCDGPVASWRLCACSAPREDDG